ncbi:MAG TPA: PAS domain S-box protein [Candidatus Limnocylindrales bacterium]|nr:PAS domain S-box protein [Candidatus Limnocylindrales bacterium]
MQWQPACNTSRGTMPAVVSPPRDNDILDLAYDAIFLLALDGTILLWNRGAETLYGWKRQEALGKVSHELLRTHFPYALETIMKDLLANGEWSGELRHTTSDGHLVTVSARWGLRRDSAGSPLGFLEINRDITAQVDAERERARLAAVVESSTEAIISKSLNGEIETWNNGAVRLYGFEKEEAIGRNIAIIVPPDRTGEEASILERVRAGEHIPAFDTVRLRKDGSLVDVSVTIFPITNEAGAVTGASHVAHDVTDRKRYEQEIRELTETLERRVEERTQQLEDANRELESFSYSVSHDLRAPIRSVDGFTRLILEETGDRLDAGVVERLQRIRGAAGRMGHLIDALLDLSRLSRSEMRREHVGLSTIAQHIANELLRGAPERDVTFEIEPDLTATGDSRLLRVLLENLLGNAFKFTAKTPHAVICFGAAWMENEWIYFVRDNGVGFEMQYSNQLFTPFQRLHGREWEGTGIGLATVHRIVIRHGGYIRVEAEPGRGATFYFTLKAEAEL